MNWHQLLSSKNGRIKLIFGTTLAVFSFFAVFKPFQLAHYSDTDYTIVLSAISLITGLSLAATHLIFPSIAFEKYQGWIEKHASIRWWLVLNVFIISCLFFIFKISAGYYDLSFARVFTGLLGSGFFILITLLVFRLSYTESPTPNTYTTLEIGKFKFNVNEIVFFESDKNYILAHLENGRVVKVRLTMKMLERHLDDYPQLMRSHRAFVINTDFIVQQSKSQIHLKGIKQTIPIGRTYKDRF